MPSAPPLTSFLMSLALASGCFAEPAAHPPFRCDDSNPCPGSQICSGGLCQDSPTTNMDFGGGSDGGTGGNDMTMATSGCADGKGTLVGSAWACPGLFSAGKAQQLCAAKYSVAQDATKVSLNACNALSGFFNANVFGKYLPPWGGSISCISGGQFDSKVVFGCGGKSGSGYEPDSATQCSGFSRAADCPTTGKDCQSPNDLTNLSNTVAGDGVLCVFTG